MFQAPSAKSKLGNYKLLSPNAGVRVSPLCLGAMNFGNKWGDFVGDITKEEAIKILDTYYEAGGNFIDTANNYQNGESEEWIGEWMENRRNRDEIVLATKYTSSIAPNGHIAINHAGNSAKSLHVSVQESLRKLRTDYIDLLYLHWWDYTTSIEEVMRSLNHLVASGKVLYLGISDTPAWVVSAANTYAKDHGLAPFVVYQGKWNISDRDFERDILPMVRQFGLGLAPWGVLGGGKFKKPEQNTNDRGRAVQEFTDRDTKVVEAIEEVANELGATIPQVALAYVIHKEPRTFPILGGRKASHLQDNIKALDLKLTQEHINKLESVGTIDLGFPHNFIGGGVIKNNQWLARSGVLDE
ncbi:hypothetical protein K7432_009828 [Basidiobolus ranarum]|uniref:NADP-dependent oxidoreductase domain-containing protein n=1 Tax=Basidiobolus ranarum TaxID=34480 RepID=A0ABR2VWG8_9FUNG